MPEPSETELKAILHSKKEQLRTHRIFQKIKEVKDLEQFMQWHVFAVWDFMSLAKRLQVEFTCVSLPWCPPSNPSASRLINDIILAEESDETNSHSYASHFELYRQAMIEVGASTEQIDRFVKLVRSGTDYRDALISVNAPKPIVRFVTSTMTCALKGKTVSVLASFVNGREDSIPGMFSSLLAQWHIDSESAPTFVYYLRRHIDLDGDSHGPAAERLVREYINDDKGKAIEYLTDSIDAVNQRIQLWNELSAVLDQTQNVLPILEERLIQA